MIFVTSGHGKLLKINLYIKIKVNKRSSWPCLHVESYMGNKGNAVLSLVSRCSWWAQLYTLPVLLPGKNLFIDLLGGWLDPRTGLDVIVIHVPCIFYYLVLWSTNAQSSHKLSHSYMWDHHIYTYTHTHTHTHKLRLNWVHLYFLPHICCINRITLMPSKILKKTSPKYRCN